MLELGTLAAAKLLGLTGLLYVSITFAVLLEVLMRLSSSEARPGKYIGTLFVVGFFMKD